MITVAKRVANALRHNEPVVALESTVITHGLPRSPLRDHADVATLIPAIDAINHDQPLNLAVALAMEQMVAHAGALPATVAIVDGELRIGLETVDLELLARSETVNKASARDLAVSMTKKHCAGTTVAATLAATQLASQDRPIRVFATGGIGGVHSGYADHLDVSADLFALAKTPVCVVCAGAKSILDLPATLELLDSLNVPVIGFQTDHLPQFVCRGNSSLNVPHRLDSIEAIAEMCHIHWNVLKKTSAILICQEVADELAVPAEVFNEAAQRAEYEARQHSIMSADLTPLLLGRIAEITNGLTLRANVGLLLENAKLASAIAAALTGGAQL